jgi:glycosyltransferase involved in cell wall biosynthesis
MPSTPRETRPIDGDESHQAAVTRPRVSVIIPAYNAARTVDQTLDSVLSQTFQDFEIVVVDDGSTDDTPAVLARRRARLRVLRKVNEGRPAAARNLGVRASCGEYVAFVDADDTWHPDKLARQVAMLDRDPTIGLVYTADATINARGDIVSVNPCPPGARGRIYDVLRVHNVMVGSSVVVRRDAFDQVGGFDQSLTSIENWDLWIRISSRWAIECIDEPLTFYRMHEGNRSGSVQLRRQNIFRVLEKHHEAAERSPEGRRIRRDAYFHAYFNVLGRGYFSRREMRLARWALLRAALLKPRWDVLRLLLLTLLGRRGFALAATLKRRMRAATISA